MLYILLNTHSHAGLSMRGVYLYVLSLYVILLLPKSAGTAQGPVVPVLGDEVCKASVQHNCLLHSLLILVIDGSCRP